MNTNSVFGVLLGTKYLATTSTGFCYDGSHYWSHAMKMLKFMNELEACGTKSAIRHLKKAKTKFDNFTEDTVRCIVKKVITESLSHSSCTVMGISIFRQITETDDSPYMQLAVSKFPFGKLQVLIEEKARELDFRYVFTIPFDDAIMKQMYRQDVNENIWVAGAMAVASRCIS